MSVVYLHNFTFKTRREAMDEFGAGRERLGRQAFWNIWRTRAKGWRLEEGDRVLLVAAWTERGETFHRVTWEVAATDVHKWDGLKDWNKATTELGKWTDWGAQEVRSNEYTASKRALAGPLYVLAWRPTAKTWIDIDLPPGVPIGRNGWTALDPSVVDAWPNVRPDLEAVARAAARRSKTKKAHASEIAEQIAVADRARQLATQWLEDNGWTIVTARGALGTWNDRAMDPSGEDWRVVVKGSTTPETAFTLSGETQGQYAVRRPKLLLAVHSIALDEASGVHPVASGGVVVPLVRWTAR